MYQFVAQIMSSLQFMSQHISFEFASECQFQFIVRICTVNACLNLIIQMNNDLLKSYGWVVLIAYAEHYAYSDAHDIGPAKQDRSFTISSLIYCLLDVGIHVISFPLIRYHSDETHHRISNIWDQNTGDRIAYYDTKLLVTVFSMVSFWSILEGEINEFSFIIIPIC